MNTVCINSKHIHIRILNKTVQETNFNVNNMLPKGWEIEIVERTSQEYIYHATNKLAPGVQEQL